MNRLIFAFNFFILLLASSCISDNEPAVESLKPGDKCPAFSVAMNTGESISSESLRGKKSIIVFFNTSCGDCRKELPEIQKVYDQISSHNLDVKLLCIARAETESSIEKFWKENNLTLPYSPQQNRDIYNLFASAMIPRIYILSPDLIITHVWSDNPIPSADTIMTALL